MPSVSRVGSLRNKITIQNTDRTTDNHGGFPVTIGGFCTLSPVLSLNICLPAFGVIFAKAVT